MIDAVLFDLDDTLYPQSSWLDGAWTAVGAAATRWGVDPARLHAALVSSASRWGSAGGGIIDRALAEIDARHVPVAPLVDAFRRYRAHTLTPYPEVSGVLARLRRHVRLGLVTDGDPRIQRSKLEALGMLDAFGTIVYSDALGREFRKPHPAPFRVALDALQTAPRRAVFIGDHPEKDVAGAQMAGMRTVRVLTGEYAHVAGLVAPWATASDVAEASATVLAHLGAPAGMSG